MLFKITGIFVLPYQEAARLKHSIRISLRNRIKAKSIGHGPKSSLAMSAMFPRLIQIVIIKWLIRLLLARLKTPPWAIHRWYTEYSPPLALADYRAHLTANGTASYPPSLDVILLGLGPEGHTASLFPDQPVLQSHDIVAHVFVPSHHSWRYTFTLPLINHAHQIAFLVTGESKQAIISELFLEHCDVPAARVNPVHGELHWFLDKASAKAISQS